MNKEQRIKDIVGKIFSLDRSKFVFVYTPPKVGSTTLVTSLRLSLSDQYNVIHIHDDIMLSVLTGINDITVNEIIEYVSRHYSSVYVIDIYRSPIERKMSEFFEKLSPYHFNNSEDNVNKYNVDRVIKRFNKLFPYLGNGDHYTEKYGLTDILAFDFDKYYTLQKVGNTNYVKLRLIDSNKWGYILSGIFGRDIVIVNDYQTQNKGIAQLYDKFKQAYKLPSNYIDMIKTCRYFNFYYSTQEQLNYLNDLKQTAEFNPYTREEYNFYVVLYLENQVYNDIQVDHYIDSGCICRDCSEKRGYLFKRAKCGERIHDRIIHSECVEARKTSQIIQKIARVKRGQNNQRSKCLNDKMSQKFSLMG